MKNGSHTMQLDTVRYCAFADPGQVQEGDTKVGLASMDIEEASEFFRNTSTNYANLFQQPVTGDAAAYSQAIASITVAVTKVECTFFDGSWS